MDQRLQALADRLGLDRGELVGLALALVGALLAALVALRVPLGLAGGAGSAGPVDVATGAMADGAAAGGVGGDPGGGVGGRAPTGDEAGDGAGDGTGAGDTVVVVHVAGAVTRPGVVTLAAGARVADAVAEVGGPSADAQLDGLNLARVLVDGEQVVVPEVGQDPAPGTGGADGDGAGVAAGAGVLPDGRVDLNSASAEQLEELPGIGEVTAGRIIAHREEQGPFEDPSELREVRGIGEARWLELRDLVGVR